MFRLFGRKASPLATTPKKALTPEEYEAIKKMLYDIIPSILSTGEGLREITPYLSKEIDHVLPAKAQIETHINTVISAYIEMTDALKLSILNHTATKESEDALRQQAKMQLERTTGLHQNVTQGLFELIANSRLNPRDCTNAMAEAWCAIADATESATSFGI